MKKEPVSTRTRTIMILVLLLPMLYAYSSWLEKSGRPRHSDFSHYWQASRMLILGQSAYDSQAWEAERDQLGLTPSGTEPTFLYPLPMVVLLMPFGFLTVERAYFLWAFLGGISLLASMLILISYYPKRSYGFELLAIGTVFLFRPTLYIIPGGQITAEFLILLVLSIYLFSRGKWFFGGLAASMIVLKPSLGIPFLALLGVWLIFRKHWTGLGGIGAGGILLYGLGALFDPLWGLNYLAIGQGAFDKYHGYQPTILGLTGLIFNADWLKTFAGIAGVFSVLAVTAYLFFKRKLYKSPFRAVAIFTVVTLMVSPYAWNYELILLLIPILYILIVVSSMYGDMYAFLFSISILGVSVILYLIALSKGHDVWSLLVSVLIWGLMLMLPEPAGKVNDYGMSLEETA